MAPSSTPSKSLFTKHRTHPSYRRWGTSCYGIGFWWEGSSSAPCSVSERHTLSASMHPANTEESRQGIIQIPLDLRNNLDTISTGYGTGNTGGYRGFTIYQSPEAAPNTQFTKSTICTYTGHQSGIPTQVENLTKSGHIQHCVARSGDRVSYPC